MSNWQGSLISASVIAPSGTAYTGKANGKWSIQDQIQAKQNNLWSKGLDKPTSPAILAVTPSNAAASISFAASTETNSPSAALTYTVTSSPGDFTNSASASPITITGLSNGVPYTYTVTATNSLGLVSLASIPSSPTGTTVPGPAGTVTAAAVSGGASVSFTAPSNTGGLPVTGYTAISTPGNFTGTASSSPIAITGLTNGTAYTFKVAATNLLGTGTYSSDSNSVTPSGTVVAFSTAGNGGELISAYSFSNGSLGTRFANPATVSGPGSLVTKTSFNPPGTVLSVVNYYPNCYMWNQGFGTKYAAPSTLGGQTQHGTFNSTNTYYAFPSANVPRIFVYSWSDAGGFGAKSANPSTLPSYQGSGIAFTKDSAAIILTEAVDPFIHAYAFSNGTIGTKYANPATTILNPKSSGKPFAFSPTGNSFIVAISTSPWVHACSWSNAGGFGSKYANPASAVPDICNTVNFSKTGGSVMVGVSLSPNFFRAYKWTDAGGFGTTTGGLGLGYPVISAECSNDNQYIMVGSGNDTYNASFPIRVTAWSDTSGSNNSFISNPTIIDVPLSISFYN